MLLRLSRSEAQGQLNGCRCTNNSQIYPMSLSELQKARCRVSEPFVQFEVRLILLFLLTWLDLLAAEFQLFELENDQK